MENLKIRTVTDWLERAPSHSTKEKYRKTLMYWVDANDFSSAENGIERLRRGDVDVYESADRMVKLLNDRGLAPLSVNLFRGTIPLFFEFLSPKLGFEREEFDRAVRRVETYKVTEDRVPTREQIRTVLVHAPNPKCKAFVAVAVNTGRRLNEVANLRVKDVEFDKKPVRVYFRAARTKKKEEALAFLSSEAAEIVGTYLRNRGFENAWLFPGSHDRDPIDKPMARGNAWRLVIQSFRAAGLDQRDGRGRNQYHPHVLRNFAANQMRSAGLNETWIDWIVGWDTKAKGHYRDMETVSRGWLDQCEPQFCFLTPKVEMEKVKVEAEAHRKELKELKQLVLDGVKTGERESEKIAALQQSMGTRKFSNHEFYYVRTVIGTEDFENALIEGYQIDTRVGDTVYMKRPRAVSA